MALEKEPFVPYKTEEEKAKEDREVFTVSINKEERAWLDEDKKILNQPKDSTALKQLAEIGNFVIHDRLIGGILATVFKNKQKNKRLGIIEYEQM